MEAITNTTSEQKCNQNIVDAMPGLYAFALHQQVPVSDTFCWHSQHSSPGVVCLHTRIKLYGIKYIIKKGRENYMIILYTSQISGLCKQMFRKYVRFPALYKDTLLLFSCQRAQNFQYLSTFPFAKAYQRNFVTYPAVNTIVFL